ncbi:hypothetical protein BH09PAT1_BH09PAT1_0210 [soil metagenome]
MIWSKGIGDSKVNFVDEAWTVDEALTSVIG